MSPITVLAIVICAVGGWVTGKGMSKMRTLEPGASVLTTLGPTLIILGLAILAGATLSGVGEAVLDVVPALPGQS